MQIYPGDGSETAIAHSCQTGRSVIFSGTRRTEWDWSLLTSRIIGLSIWLLTVLFFLPFPYQLGKRLFPAFYGVFGHHEPCFIRFPTLPPCLKHGGGGERGTPAAESPLRPAIPEEAVRTCNFVPLSSYDLPISQLVQQFCELVPAQSCLVLNKLKGHGVLLRGLLVDAQCWNCSQH